MTVATHHLQLSTSLLFSKVHLFNFCSTEVEYELYHPVEGSLCQKSWIILDYIKLILKYSCVLN